MFLTSVHLQNLIFFPLPPVNVTILPFTCQSHEIRERGLTDMLDKRAITSTERLNRLASPPSGRADTPGINQAAASPQPGASRVRRPTGTEQVKLTGSRKRLFRLGFASGSAVDQLTCESATIQLTVLPLMKVLALTTSEGEGCCGASEAPCQNLPNRKKIFVFLALLLFWSVTAQPFILHCFKCLPSSF